MGAFDMHKTMPEHNPGSVHWIPRCATVIPYSLGPSLIRIGNHGFRSWFHRDHPGWSLLGTAEWM